MKKDYKLDRKKLSIVLNDLINKQNISKDELSKSLNLSPSNLEKFLQNKASFNLSQDSIDLLHNLYNVSYEDIYYYDEIKRKEYLEKELTKKLLTQGEKYYVFKDDSLLRDKSIMIVLLILIILTLLTGSTTMMVSIESYSIASIFNIFVAFIYLGALISTCFLKTRIKLNTFNHLFLAKLTKLEFLKVSSLKNSFHLNLSAILSSLLVVTDLFSLITMDNRPSNYIFIMVIYIVSIVIQVGYLFYLTYSIKKFNRVEATLDGESRTYYLEEN